MIEATAVPWPLVSRTSPVVGVPVEKSAGTIDATAVLAERTNMLFMGTSITRGSTVGVVTATGLDSELGRISALIARPGVEQTPLEQRLSVAFAELSLI